MGGVQWLFTPKIVVKDDAIVKKKKKDYSSYLDKLN